LNGPKYDILAQFKYH